MPSRVSVEVNGKTTGLKSELDKAKRYVGDFKRSAGGVFSSMFSFFSAPFLATIGTITGGLGLVALLVKSVRDAMGSRQTANFYERYFPADQARRVAREIKSLGAAPPFDSSQFDTAARRLLVFGVAGDKLIGTLRMIGDVAASTQQPIETITELYGRAKLTGVVDERVLRGFIKAGVPLLEEFGSQLGVTAGQARVLAKEGRVSFEMLEKALRHLTGPGGQYAGELERQGNTALGVFQRLQKRVNSLWGSLGSELLDSLTPVFRLLLVWVEKLRPAFTEVGKFLGRALRAAVAAIQVGKFGELLQLSLQVGLLKAISFFEQHKDSIASVLITAFRLAGNTILTVLDQPLRHIQARIEQMIQTVQYLADKAGGLKDDTSGLGSLSDDQRKGLAESWRKVMSQRFDELAKESGLDLNTPAGMEKAGRLAAKDQAYANANKEYLAANQYDPSKYVQRIETLDEILARHKDDEVRVGLGEHTVSASDLSDTSTSKLEGQLGAMVSQLAGLLAPDSQANQAQPPARGPVLSREAALEEGEGGSPDDLTEAQGELTILRAKLSGQASLEGMLEREKSLRSEIKRLMAAGLTYDQARAQALELQAVQGQWAVAQEERRQAILEAEEHGHTRRANLLKQEEELRNRVAKLVGEGVDPKKALDLSMSGLALDRANKDRRPAISASQLATIGGGGNVFAAPRDVQLLELKAQTNLLRSIDTKLAQPRDNSRPGLAREKMRP